ncbi:HAMP domain-containing sensor histidine kinase [Alicyclobacillus sp. SO9]|uniref:HAMP domain-containing sensor histidine kinase n=1 Tax=Alicyclobacillus sp. SO9 TaxID=2665646 RepID=UPI0018E6FDD1|nr:HAMP domain-containing sensor histidine kinase [Alicyclobacillus sp. SO9]QQE80039.1 HAMP domain-containing histidine kinase [Alicyclobacillus sp. SO9]
MTRLPVFPKQSLRRRVMVLVTTVILAMSFLDLVAAHWSLQQSLYKYSRHNQTDQTSDWAQMMGVLYDEFGSWNAVRQHLASESSLHIDGQKLSQLEAVVVPNNGGVIRTQSHAKRKPDWQSAPILFQNTKVGTFYMHPYISPQVRTLKRRITYGFDTAQFLVVFIISIVAFLFVVVLVRSFLRPLEDLAATAISMTAGAFDAPLPTGGDVEIQNVINAFAVTRNRLQEAQETRKRILADIHHELRTPLNVIGNRLEAIHLGLYQWDKQTATILHEETERIQTIVDELDELNEVQAGVQKLDLAWVSVEDWLTKLVTLFEAEATRRSVNINVHIEDKSLCILMDKNRMSQVIINLISNALRYTPPGKRIIVTVRNAVHGVVFTVEDEGIGIDSSHLPFIFERLYRIEPSRSRDKEGAGLGLAIVKEVVDAHAGEVTVRSLPGKGTRFTILIPPQNSLS